MKSIEDLIRQHPFFARLGGAQLETIAGCALQTHFRPGETIFKEGADAGHFYLVQHGRIALQAHLPERGGVLIETIHDHGLVGVSWLFPPHKWMFDGVASVETTAIRFDGGCIRKKCEADAALGYGLMKCFGEILAERLQSTRLRLLDIYR